MENNQLGFKSLVALHSDVMRRKVCLGLITRLYYLPTNSQLHFYTLNYDHSQENKLMDLLAQSDAALIKLAAKGVRFTQALNDSFLLEYCCSQDRQFAALHLSKWDTFGYVPVGEVRYLSGDAAQAVSQILL